MDRKSAIGFFLISLILIGWMWLNKPSEEEIAEQKRKAEATESVKADTSQEQEVSQDLALDTDSTLMDSTSVASEKFRKYGVFSKFVDGVEEEYVLENELLKIKLSNKGGRISYVELKKYQTFDSLPLVLLKKATSKFEYYFTSGGLDISSSDLYFKFSGDKMSVKGDDSLTAVLRLEIAPDKYLEHVIKMRGNDYMVDYSIRMVGFNEIIPRNTKHFELAWKVKTNRTEREANKQSARITRNFTTIYYKYVNDSPEYLKDMKEHEQEFAGNVKWVAFKQNFFTQTLIYDDFFIKGEIKSNPVEGSFSEKVLEAALVVPFSHKQEEQYDLSFYFGPNHFKTLKKYDLELERQIYLGRGILRFINVHLVIKVFDFLSKYFANYGIIILLLTLFIKMILLPLTFKSYQSTAKMRVLKPELDAIKEKVGKDAAKQQQEQMKLYRQAGVSPLGGCLPMLLQMPILIALFRFFPSSIELRQQSFLWAHDLSTFDSIWDFPNGFKIPGYGDHVSLFTLLMTISTLIYTRMNSQMMGGSGEMAKQMKVMQYIMPIMFLGFFNNYSAGLSYYYFLANIITFGQQYLFKILMNENKLRKKIDENKKKRAKKPKSNWQKRLEEMQKVQQQQAKGGKGRR